jgi:hypothetical protein
MANRFGVELHPKDVRWAVAEGVSQDVIAAVLLLHERSVDEIAPQLSARELEQTIVLVGRSPRLYARGTLEALESKRATPRPPAEAASDGARPKRRGASTDAGADDSPGPSARPFSGMALGGQQSPPERQKGGEASDGRPNTKTAVDFRFGAICGSQQNIHEACTPRKQW